MTNASDGHGKAQYEELCAAYRDRAIAPDTLFLLAPKDALTFIDHAKSLGLVLIGIDGFKITPEGAYQPIQDYTRWREGNLASLAEFERGIATLIQNGEAAKIYFQISFDQL